MKPEPSHRRTDPPRAGDHADRPADSLGGDGDGVEVVVEADAWLAAVPDAVILCRRAAMAARETGCMDGIGPKAGPGDGASGEACIVLSGDGPVRDLNRRFRGVDAATNVLAFEAMTAAERARSPDPAFPAALGDVVVALETVLREAAAMQKRPGDHLSHLVVHGMLHLCGYDHRTDAEATVMEGLETRVLAGLGIEDPYAVGDRHDP